MYLYIRAKKIRAAGTNFNDNYSYSHVHGEHMIRPHIAHLSFAASSIAMGMIMCISMNIMN